MGTEHLLFAEGVLIIAVVFYSVAQLKLEPEHDLGSLRSSTLSERVLFSEVFKFVQKTLLEQIEC